MLGNGRTDFPLTTLPDPLDQLSSNQLPGSGDLDTFPAMPCLP
jgi:hypothetical protein